MLVRCPSCATTYKVADEILTGTTPAFRCSRCKHTFEGELTSSDDGVPLSGEIDSRIGGDDDGGELNFVFEPKDQELMGDRDQGGVNAPLPAHFPAPDSVDSLVEQERPRWSLPGEV